MYSRIKSTFFNTFHKSPNSLTKEEKKKLRHSLAECQLSGDNSGNHAPSLFWTDRHAPLAPQEEEEEYLNINNITSVATSSTSSADFHNQTVFSNLSSDTTKSVFDSSGSSGVFDDVPIMPAYSLSWNIKYVGSFPVSNSHEQYLHDRMVRFKPAEKPQNVNLSVSMLGVRLCVEQNLLMSHSLRRLVTYVGSPDYTRFAYVAVEESGKTYRRLCHVFYTRDNKQVGEIIAVLDQAFLTNRRAHQQPGEPTATLVTTAIPEPENRMSSTGSTMTEKRSASTVFLNKFLGKKGSQTIDDSACKRKRRPVSAVFSSAIHRLSNSATTTNMNAKRMTTTEFPYTHKHRATSPLPVSEQSTARTASSLTSGSSSSSGSDIENQKRVSKDNMSSGISSSSSPIPPTLEFDEKLGEWYYPIDETTISQLENCNYFVKLPSKSSINTNLASKPEGAFVIRFSESKNKFLALTMRVPFKHSSTGISHYLIIRNEHGYRLKLNGTNKPFPTLQMLLTHHSVIEGQLPCTLCFVQWNKSDWRQVPQSTIEKSANRHHNRHSTALTKIDENRNLTSTPLANSTLLLNRRCGIEEYGTPKRRSRNDLNAIRRSQFFDLEDRRIIS